MNKKLEKQYIEKLEACLKENTHLNKSLTEMREDIRKIYLPQFQDFYTENVRLQHMVFDLQRSYFALHNFATDAKKLGIDVGSQKLPENNPYEGFEMKTILMESGKTKTTMTAKLAEKYARRKNTIL